MKDARGSSRRWGDGTARTRRRYARFGYKGAGTQPQVDFESTDFPAPFQNVRTTGPCGWPAVASVISTDWPFTHPSTALVLPPFCGVHRTFGRADEVLLPPPPVILGRPRTPEQVANVDAPAVPCRPSRPKHDTDSRTSPLRPSRGARPATRYQDTGRASRDATTTTVARRRKLERTTASTNPGRSDYDARGARAAVPTWTVGLRDMEIALPRLPGTCTLRRGLCSTTECVYASAVVSTWYCSSPGVRTVRRYNCTAVQLYAYSRVQ